MIAVRRRASLGVLAEKTDESDAIFAEQFLVFLSCPDRLGRPGAKGAALKPSESSFSEGPNQIVCDFAKAKPAIWDGDRSPLGLERWSAGAERGNSPEAKPNREGLKGRPAHKNAKSRA